METPIFIFSLPRSGSTLLQRVLMSNPQICSVSEPWILLPQIYILRKEGTLSDYSSLTAHKGNMDFINNLSNKEEDYFDSLRQFMLDLYSKQCQNNEQYFLDKTPRYYLIIDEIVKLFPKAKFIFLFRNPIHVFASIINTWGKGRFRKQYANYNDIVDGTKMLSQGYSKYMGISISIKYEDFILNPLEELDKVSNYLNIDFNKESLKLFNSQNTKGSLGDFLGPSSYSEISSNGLGKWKTTFNSKIRKKFAISLIKKIRSEDLELQGYNQKEIICEINALNSKQNSKFFMDLFDYIVGYIIRKFNLNLFFVKEFSWIKKRPLS